MMKEFIDKLIGRLEKNGQKMCEAKSNVPFGKHSPANHRYYKAISIKKAIHIVNQLAEEYNNGWIPASVQYEPTEYGKYIVYVRHEENHDISDIFTIAWYGAWNLNSSWDVIAWMPIPDYQPKGE